MGHTKLPPQLNATDSSIIIFQPFPDSLTTNRQHTITGGTIEDWSAKILDIDLSTGISGLLQSVVKIEGKVKWQIEQQGEFGFG